MGAIKDNQSWIDIFVFIYQKIMIINKGEALPNYNIILWNY